MDSIDLEIIIEGEDPALVHEFGDGHEGGVGEVHGDVAVFFHEAMGSADEGVVEGMKA